jgi:choline dehydrogenase-like flavoprotein
MSSVLIVGSGPSGVHLAQTLLARGHVVTMLDVGHQKPAAVLPDADFDGLKELLADPASYFLGASAEGVVFPSKRAGYFAHPPSKSYVFAAHAGFEAQTYGIEPVISFAAGGLAEAWTGGSYPLNDAELQDFPFSASDLRPHYTEVIRRIGIAAGRDDIEHFSPWFDDYLEPLVLDPHSKALLDAYGRRRAQLNRKLGFYLGRSRVAVLSRDLGDRQACSNLGRCLWGCPRQALYAPSSTLRQLQGHSSFRYLPDTLVTHFSYEDGAITGFLARDSSGKERKFEAEVYALAAGALCSSKIYLDSIYRRTGEVHQLGGLMDNRQILMPFLTPALLGKGVTTHAYQFHQLALGIARPRPEELIHGQITTLKSASVHPVVQSLPLDLRSALTVFRQTHAALGAANIWLHDRRSASNVLTIRPRPGSSDTDLVLRYSGPAESLVTETVQLASKGLRSLGCILPPGMTKLLASGASVHYAGLLPMGGVGRFATTAECGSNEFGNLYVADGATFPFLPAKNLTFTLMANAVRVGESIAARFAA